MESSALGSEDYLKYGAGEERRRIMAVKVFAKELPKSVRVSVAETIRTTLSEHEGAWTVFITPHARNNAWDVEVKGPLGVHWERRFSGNDRDGEVIAEAIRSATLMSGEHPTEKQSKHLRDALSELAVQGIAFLSKVGENGETLYVVDRIELKESEIVHLHNQRALTRRGIQRYLLTRNAA
jgi:hypothetical protein